MFAGSSGKILPNVSKGYCGQYYVPPTPSTQTYIFAAGVNDYKIHRWEWSDSSGFGSKISSNAFGTNQTRSIRVTSNGSAVIFGHFNTPYIRAVQHTTSSGFGTEYSSPSTLIPGALEDLDLSPDNSAIVISHNNSPFISAYPWNNSTGFGAKYSNPSTLPSAVTYGVRFSPSSNKIICTQLVFSGARLIGYNWSSGFGSQITPATQLLGYNGSQSDGNAFHPSENAIVVGHNTSPFISAYAWNSSTGFGTKYSNPSSLPPAAGRSVDFHPNGNAVIVGHSNSPFITAYAWNSSTGFGTKYSDPSSLQNTIGLNVRFSPTGGAVISLQFASTGASWMHAWQWNSSTGFGTKYSSPSSGQITTRGMHVITLQI